MTYASEFLEWVSGLRQSELEDALGYKDGTKEGTLENLGFYYYRIGSSSSLTIYEQSENGMQVPEGISLFLTSEEFGKKRYLEVFDGASRRALACTHVQIEDYPIGVDEQKIDGILRYLRDLIDTRRQGSQI